MKIVITGDSLKESRISEILSCLEKNGYRDFFKDREYGEPLFIGVVFRCVQPAIKLKSRARWNSAKRFLGIDIVLPTSEFLDMTQIEKCAIVARRLLSDVTMAVRSKELPGVNRTRLLEDLKQWIDQIKW